MRGDMKIRVLGCHGGELPDFRTTSFLINKRIILDAGAVTGVLNLKEQLAIEHVILTHAHADHSRDTLFLADNVIGSNGKGFMLYGMPVVLKSIKQHLLNWHIWPDFTELPNKSNPVITMQEVESENTVVINGLEITLCMVNHTVPAAGVLIDDGSNSVVFSSDTAPTERIWELAAKKNNLKAVFIECSYPTEKKELALLSKHLTPALLRDEIKKIGRDTMIYVYHIKPQFYKRIVKELKQQHLPHIEAVKLNQVITI